MDAFQVVVSCIFDIIKLVFVVSCLYGAWYFGYSAGWRDCKQMKTKARNEHRKLMRYYY